MVNKNLSGAEQTISLNGINLYYEVHGTGYPLLVLHGFTGSGAELVPLFDSLTETHQLIIPDLRGHGRSTNPTKKFTHRDAANDLLELLQHLNIHECSAIGFSAGGNILLHMATLQPNKIRSMAIVSATPYYPDQARECMKQFTIESRTKNDWEFMRKIHPQGEEQIKMLWQQANDFHENYDDMNFTPSLLTTITTKTFIIQGDRDPLYSAEISVEMYKHIPNAYLWIIPNGGHVPLDSDVMPIFLNYVKTFL